MPRIFSAENIYYKILNFKQNTFHLKVIKATRRIKSFANRKFRHSNLKSPIRGPETIWIRDLPSNSLSKQDVFVLENLGRKRNGSYLEIGAGWYQKINNTFVLEKFYGWKGLSIDIDKKLVAEFNLNRNNLCLEADALNLDYEKILSRVEMPRIIDYLSIDIDPAYQSLKILTVIPWHEYKFRTITFEHDAYLNGNSIKYLSRLFLSKIGYKLAKTDVSAESFGKYEDWYILSN